MKKSKQLTKILSASLLGLACLFSSPAHAQTGQNVYTYVEQMPQFEGGETAMLQFLGTNIRYPEDAKKAGTEGLVVLTFVVAENGALEGVEIIKSLSQSTDAEALRVTRLMDGKWKPGRQSGKNVAVRYTLPLRFAMKTEACDATQPRYKGGQQTLQQLFTMPADVPADAQVSVRFTVNPDGTVHGLELADAKLVKTVTAGQEVNYMDPATFNLRHKNQLAKLAEAAAQAVRATSGNWLPATQNGKPIEKQITLSFPNTQAPEPQQQPTSDASYTFAQTDVQPQLQQGPFEKFIAKNMRYPSQTDFAGDVALGFVISKEGKLLGPVISSEVAPEIRQEIERVFSLSQGTWKAGLVNGQPVTATKKMRIRFVTQGAATVDSTGSADVVITRYK